MVSINIAACCPPPRLENTLYDQHSIEYDLTLLLAEMSSPTSTASSTTSYTPSLTDCISPTSPLPEKQLLSIIDSAKVPSLAFLQLNLSPETIACITAATSPSMIPQPVSPALILPSSSAQTSTLVSRHSEITGHHDSHTAPFQIPTATGQGRDALPADAVDYSRTICSFWYHHGDCRLVRRNPHYICRFRHFISSRFTLIPPPGFVHHRICMLSLCPLRTVFRDEPAVRGMNAHGDFSAGSHYEVELPYFEKEKDEIRGHDEPSSPMATNKQRLPLRTTNNRNNQTANHHSARRVSMRERDGAKRLRRIEHRRREAEAKDRKRLGIGKVRNTPKFRKQTKDFDSGERARMQTGELMHSRDARREGMNKGDVARGEQRAQGRKQMRDMRHYAHQHAHRGRNQTDTRTTQLHDARNYPESYSVKDHPRYNVRPLLSSVSAKTILQDQDEKAPSQEEGEINESPEWFLQGFPEANEESTKAYTEKDIKDGLADVSQGLKKTGQWAFLFGQGHSGEILISEL
ncbi:hypothetical protein EJ05DRAFT_197508 [Pseudovirgaria hyperparasitica]|uniref:C3H1-type domain-containing protein n=1 Tax=Pseudovirgaria hyperparasitica TaxID=470096 RepID=A0A6A6WH28_9PEZI|nr:uncharacterized protein EJ05DRAFT_197508 [Pseudovirgaria hyperparasitica]KAF2762108.1 hypothetical protein EJ05DRAFT_197508 [Pseudovirgaria hyperparasitica]